MPASLSLQLRLALRVEGAWWVAYVAQTDSMEGAVELGRIRMASVTGLEGFARRQSFTDLMRSALGDEVAAVTGATPHWPEPDGTPAPEHERGTRTGGVA
ncbi:MAG: hypothetical protein BWX69_03150 [Planctomycetes bacterium ADurb.Bin069]|nr:MAG: hypothetical protein BWX69_03150 [Planctomycetes bacterium ADurb.Bin069]